MSKQVTIAVIGKGKVGSSLARKIGSMHSHYKLFAHLSGRKASFPELMRKGGPEVIFICTKDDRISSVAKKALKSTGENLAMLVHCAGSRESTILPFRSSISRLTLHPIQTFAATDAKLLEHIYYMASSDDRRSKLWAKKFVRNIGGKGIIEIRGKDLALYHTLVVFASNFTTLLGGSIELLSKTLGISSPTMKKAVAPLMHRSLENVLHHRAADTLTGPLARKDSTTILKHRKALRSQAAALGKIYEGFVMLAEEIL